VVVRRARTSDVPEVKRLVDTYSGRILLEKNLVTLYEAVQEFWVAELDGDVVGCGALHVLWSDLGEVRTVAVDPKVRGKGIGHAIVDRLLEVSRELQLQRLFVLTFETEFFGRHGFEPIEESVVEPDVFAQLALSPDDVLVSGGDDDSLRFWDWDSGAPFLDLETRAQPGSLDAEAGVLALATGGPQMLMFRKTVSEGFYGSFMTFGWLFTKDLYVSFGTPHDARGSPSLTLPSRAR
jgi:amino-acid N-acetyltransferase